MVVEIRPAVRDDVEGIRRVATTAWHAAHAPIVGEDTVEEFLAEHYDAASFRQRIDHEDAILDVATDAETVVGYALASPVEDDRTTFGLSQIYVDPEEWGNGVGGRLLDRVERRVVDAGGDRIRLGVMADNDRAIRFYEDAGYDRADGFHDERIGTRGYTYRKNLGRDEGRG